MSLVKNEFRQSHELPVRIVSDTLSVQSLNPERSIFLFKIGGFGFTPQNKKEVIHIVVFVRTIKSFVIYNTENPLFMSLRSLTLKDKPTSGLVCQEHYRDFRPTVGRGHHHNDRYR